MDRFKLFTLQGEAIDLAKYKGKAIFLNFWATWCKPCVEEMPTIKNAIDSLKDRDIQFLFASDESPEQIEAFEGEHHFGFNYVKADHIEELGIVGFPTTFIFNKEGKKIFSEIGYRKWDEKNNLNILLKSIK
jgi:thiol-disulfide isomerase/thioredoxin